MVGLIWTLIRTDFKVRYHGTIGGFVWALLKPVSMFLVLLAVFSFIFAPTDPYYRPNLILGLFLWEFFAEGTKVGLVSLFAKGYLLTKTRFPRWIVVATPPPMRPSPCWSSQSPSCSTSRGRGGFRVP